MMKKVLMVLLAVALISALVVPVCSADPRSCAEKWIERAIDNGKISAEAVPEVWQIYYVDLMSNASAQGWFSFLVIVNWDVSSRIQIQTQFIPTGGDPFDMQQADFFIDPNETAVMSGNQLGFNNFGQANWFGIVWGDVVDWWTVGVLLYNSEYGMTWIPADGPY